MDFLGRIINAAATALEFHLLRWWREYIVASIALISILWSGYMITVAPPPNFPVGKIEVVKRGASLSTVSAQLAQSGVIAHPIVFESIVRLLGRAGTLQSGAYKFAVPESAFAIALRLISGDSEIPPIRVTFPEGLTALEMSRKVAKTTLIVTAEEFLSAAGPYEGYLFPDTYVFDPSLSATDVVHVMQKNFDTRIADIMPFVAASGHSLSDVVILASLVEREARSYETKRMVAGIMWNRIEIGMPLQVDAVFGYIYGRTTYSPSLEDLSIDSPYNTYQHKGLPPGPISNPGLASLTAAANPIKSDYLFYLTGRDGNMHYATTFAVHKVNRAKYLD